MNVKTGNQSGGGSSEQPSRGGSHFRARLFSGEDSEGELFTPDELVAALYHLYPVDEARELCNAWTETGIAAPGKGWSENILVLVAATVHGREDRIRRHLGHSPERMQKLLEEVRAEIRLYNEQRGGNSS